ncbi:hypothetical protein [uncultured Cohaesibacter sp.]|uniref:hypothetical protein n=1 Tax=uncultured Cohaesibacter sp. TaxID=1002546 RepID=UPI0029C7F7DB|nr:hypothetical protein [uncultured Cohaesibacter sp.]
MKRTGLLYRSVRSAQIAFCLLFLIFTASVFPNFARAQDAGQPLNLGEVIQKEAKPAPSYLKLPETVPIPEAKPAMEQDAPEAGTDTAAEPTDTPDAINDPLGAEQAETPTTGNEGTAPDASAMDGVDPLMAPIPGQSVQPETPPEPEIEEGGVARLQLTALLSDEGDVLQRGVDWRIYEEKRDENGRMPLIENVEGGPTQIELPTGKYIVYAGYGYANLTKRIVLNKAGDYAENFNLQAGAVRLNAVATGDIPLDKRHSNV